MRHRTTPHDGNSTSEISGLEQCYKNAQAFGCYQRGPAEYVEIRNKCKYTGAKPFL
jgi:hypothetical protein